MKKPLTALAFGTFALGMTEYVMMGVLPFIAKDFRISIPEAGAFISAYALGVCAGAPVVAIMGRTWPLKRILCVLVSIMMFASLAMALCPVPSTDEGTGWHYWLFMLFRFCAGFPHGAYFGAGSIVADRLAKNGKSTLAVAIMTSGMTFANLVGVPFGTFLTSLLSWRLVFAFSAVWCLITLVCIVRMIPYMEPLPNTGLKGSFRFLAYLAPWLIIFGTVMCNGGIFSWYSYISPTLTDLAGIPVSWLTIMMVLAGAGMVIGNLVGGELSDHFGPGNTCRGLALTAFLCLVLIAFTADNKFFLVPLMMITCGCLFAISPPQQILLLRYSKGGELMGGAMVQLAFNLGNAIGARVGGLPINEADPTTYHLPAAYGAGLAFCAIVGYIYFCKKYGGKTAKE